MNLIYTNKRKFRTEIQTSLKKQQVNLNPYLQTNISEKNLSLPHRPHLVFFSIMHL